MAKKIGLISDIHAYLEPLQAALALFEAEKVDFILCAGDIAGYGNQLGQVVGLLAESGCYAIRGNHEEWYMRSVTDKDDSLVYEYFFSLPDFLEITLEGIKLYMVHVAPVEEEAKGIRLLDESGMLIPQQLEALDRHLSGFEQDILIVGHTHQVFCEKLEKTLVINPGSTQFNHSCGILTLPDMSCEFYPLSGKRINKTWNWSTGYSPLDQ